MIEINVAELLQRNNYLHFWTADINSKWPASGLRVCACIDLFVSSFLNGKTHSLSCVIFDNLQLSMQPMLCCRRCATSRIFALPGQILIRLQVGLRFAHVHFLFAFFE